MKCSKKLFCKEGIINNIGNYIMSSIIIMHIISVILFKIKGYQIIKNMIDNIVKKNMSNNFQQNYEKNDNSINEKNAKNENIYNNKKKRIKFKRKAGKKKTNQSSGHLDIKNPLKKKKKHKVISNENKNISSQQIEKFNSKYNIHIFPKNSTNNLNLNFSNSNKNLEKIDKARSNQIKNFYNFNDYELNRLLYYEALKIDKRTFFGYYFSLLKEKHLLILAFFTNNDYNSKIIKIFLFFFTFSLYYTINALFFNYTTMNKIYEDNGSFNFLFQLPQIIYSALISSVICLIINYLALSQNDIVELKKEKYNINQKASSTLKCLIIKFFIFFILSFLFLIFFWYYISCFSAIYKNTQEHLIKDAIYSFIFSLLYPLLLYFLPGIFRITSLRAKNKNRQILYIFSQILQIF